MEAKSPIFLWLSSLYKLMFKFFEINIIFLLLLDLLALFLGWLSFLILIFILFVSLFDFFFTWIYFHSIDDIIIYHPDIILVISSDRLSSVGPIRLVIFLNCMILLLILRLALNYIILALLFFLFILGLVGLCWLLFDFFWLLDFLIGSYRFLFFLLHYLSIGRLLYGFKWLVFNFLRYFWMFFLGTRHPQQ